MDIGQLVPRERVFVDVCIGVDDADGGFRT
jgi:hypothetical protein